MGWLDGFTGAASKKAANASMTGQRENADMLAWGGENARKSYGDALSLLERQYGTAQKLYQPMTETGQLGVNAYTTAMGLGPGGSAGAQEAFRATPGYEFARSQGEDSVMRNAAARGMLAGGNTSADLLRFGTGIADQTYGSYLQRLNPLMNMYGQGIQGQANAAIGYGNQGANQYDQMGQSFMNEAQGRGRALAGIGEANAGGIIGAANAQGGMINSGLNLVGKLLGYGFG
jgi:hypothetical protein